MSYPYQDPTLSADKRVEDLLSRMTLKEKLAQMQLQFITEEQAAKVPFDMRILAYNEQYCGNLYNTYSLTPETIRAIQDHYLHNTRLGIPVAVHGEALHGNKNVNATVFPQAIGMGATFNPKLMRQIAEVAGKEARANGTTLVYAPNLDVTQDPRWGRTEETMGEDPYLIGEMGAAYTRALQAQGVAACAKHFALYGAKEGGLNLSPCHIGEHEAWETMLPPFQKNVEAGVMGIMPAFSDWEGIPVHANRKLLTGILREKMGFQGQTVADYGALVFLRTLHHVAATRLEAGKMALHAGLDVECCAPASYGIDMEAAILRGEVDEKLVDQAVRRVLRFKFEMGLFEDPYSHPETPCRTPESIALARQAGQESVTLLKNEHELLPLSDAIGSVAIIGPNADTMQMGDYTDPTAMARGITLRKALVERLGEDRVHYAKGCGIASGTEKEQAQAVEAAQKADVAVVVLGDNSNFHGGIGWGEEDPDGKVVVTCGEGFDMHTLELPDCQQKLLEAVWATGKPVILVMETGRPYAIRWAKENAAAILQAWYPGEQGGYALTDILFGDVDPSGRLPISFPRSVGHIPSYYNYKMSARGYYRKPGSQENPGRDYVFDTPEALFHFGDGLSYTTFAYSDLQVERTGKTDAKVTVTVENTGKRKGCEVVLLYVTDRYCRITPFVRRLRGFEKIWLEPGQKQQVTFTLGFEDFAFVNEQMELEVEPGEFVLRAGTEQIILELQ